MAAPVQTGTRTMDTIDLPVRSGSNVSGEESSGSNNGTEHVLSGEGCDADVSSRGPSSQVTEDNGSRQPAA